MELGANRWGWSASGAGGLWVGVVSRWSWGPAGGGGQQVELGSVGRGGQQVELGPAGGGGQQVGVVSRWREALRAAGGGEASPTGLERETT